MTDNKISRALRQRIKVLPTPAGYAVQVYGQTVIRSLCLREARRLASDLRRALR